MSPARKLQPSLQERDLLAVLPFRLYRVSPVRCATVIVLRLAVLLLAVAVASCKQEIQFTRTPFAGVIETDQTASETTIFLSVPVDVAPAAEAAFSDPVARARAFVDDIACDRRKGVYVECIGAVVTSELTRSGAIEATTDGARLLIKLPLTYDIGARGHGWASYLTDRKTGTVTVGIPFDVSLSSTYGTDVRVAGDLVWSEKTIPILKGKVPLAGMVDAKIKVQIKAITDILRTTLAGQYVRERAENAWRALHAPIELTRSPSLWMRGQPERVFSSGFAKADGAIVYRLGIDSKIRMHRGERPGPPTIKPIPAPQRSTSVRAEPVQAHLRLPFDVGALALQEAVAKAFPKSDVIETRAEPSTQSVKVRPIAVSAFPARDRLALELQLDVIEPSRLLGMTGRAYLVGTPVYDPVTGILELRDVGFPGAPQTAGKASEGVLRIGEEPFAGRFAAATRLDMGRVIEGLRPRINAMLSRPLDDTVTLSGAFESMTVAGVEPVKDGFRLILDLKGALSVAVHASGKGQDAPEIVRATSAISRPPP